MRDNGIQYLLELFPVKGFGTFTCFHIDWNVAFPPAFQVVKKLGPSRQNIHI